MKLSLKKVDCQLVHPHSCQVSLFPLALVVAVVIQLLQNLIHVSNSSQSPNLNKRVISRAGMSNSHHFRARYIQLKTDEAIPAFLKKSESARNQLKIIFLNKNIQNGSQIPREWSIGFQRQSRPVQIGKEKDIDSSVRFISSAGGGCSSSLLQLVRLNILNSYKCM